VSRYTGPVIRISRREGIPLSPKAERYFAKNREKISPPGQHATRRANKPSEYSKRLREKQKARFFFGIHERQFRRYFQEASHQKGNTGENLLRLLETRLDNIVRRLGFAGTMPAARQLVSHGHVLINNKRVDIPSCKVKPGDQITVESKYRANIGLKRSLKDAVGRGLPGWLEWDSSIPETLKRSGDATGGLPEGIVVTGTVKTWPSRQEMSLPVNEQFIVELYSK